MTYDELARLYDHEFCMSCSDRKEGILVPATVKVQSSISFDNQPVVSSSSAIYLCDACAKAHKEFASHSGELSFKTIAVPLDQRALSARQKQSEEDAAWQRQLQAWDELWKILLAPSVDTSECDGEHES